VTSLSGGHTRPDARSDPEHPSALAHLFELDSLDLDLLEPLADHHVRAKRVVGIRLSPTEPTAPIKRRSSCRAATEATDFEAGR
jgi:hypothetical protein